MPGTILSVSQALTHLDLTYAYEDNDSTTEEL